jgi:hypothetical protein
MASEWWAKVEFKDFSLEWLLIFFVWFTIFIIEQNSRAHANKNHLFTSGENRSLCASVKHRTRYKSSFLPLSLLLPLILKVGTPGNL